MKAEHSTKSGKIPETGKKQRLDAALAGLLDELSRERIKSLVTNGNLTIDGETVTDPAAKKYAGKEFELVVLAPIEGPARPQDIPLDVVFRG